MKWSNLKVNKCPQCNKSMSKATQVGRSLTTKFIHPCGFQISNLRWSQIVNNQVNRSLPDEEAEEKLQEEEDNL